MTLTINKDNKRRGILMMLIACLFFSLMDAVMKRLAADFPAIQVTALRAMSSLPIIVAYVSWRGAWPSLWQVRWPLHVFRVALGVLMLCYDVTIGSEDEGIDERSWATAFSFDVLVVLPAA